jgi:hypothetical protein
MDELSTFRQIVKEQTQACADRFVQVAYEVSPVFDDERGHYLLMLFGRDQDKRIHDTILHFRLHNGKVWVELDEAFEGITTDLVEAGIPRDKIVLAMHSPWKRQFTEFAVA